MNNVIPFNFEDHQVRSLLMNEEPWFVAVDVCNVLDISNVTQAMQRLDEDERSMFNIGRQGETNLVNESGLYSLILRSRKPEAKRFKRWVTHEVLPAIRRSGRYEEKPAPEQKEVTEVVDWLLSKVVNGRVKQQYSIPAHCTIINRTRDDTLEGFINGCDQAYLNKLIHKASSAIMKLQNGDASQKTEAPLKALPAAQHSVAVSRPAPKFIRIEDHRDITIDMLKDLLKGRTPISVEEVLEEFFNIKKRTVTRAYQMRVGRILTALGYTRFRETVGNSRAWRYHLVSTTYAS